MAALSVVALISQEGFYPVMSASFACSGLLFFVTRDLPAITTGAAPALFKETWKGVRDIMIPITGILVARGFLHGCIAVFLPAFIAMTTGNLRLAGAGLTLYEAAGVMVAGTLSERFGRRRMLMFSMMGFMGLPFVLMLAGTVKRRPDLCPTEGLLLHLSRRRRIGVRVNDFKVLSPTPAFTARGG